MAGPGVGGGDGEALPPPPPKTTYVAQGVRCGTLSNNLCGTGGEVWGTEQQPCGTGGEGWGTEVWRVLGGGVGLALLGVRAFRVAVKQEACYCHPACHLLLPLPDTATRPGTCYCH